MIVTTELAAVVATDLAEVVAADLAELVAADTITRKSGRQPINTLQYSLRISFMVAMKVNNVGKFCALLACLSLSLILSLFLS